MSNKLCQETVIRLLTFFISTIILQTAIQVE